MEMKVVGARWTPTVNMIEIECSCGTRFEVRADRRKVACPNCLTVKDLLKLKGEDLFLI